MPRGTAKREVSFWEPPYGNRWRLKIISKSRIKRTAPPVACYGESPSFNHTANKPAPIKQPTLQKAWKPDISLLPIAFSTSTAWIFTVTSTSPMDAPKASRTGTASQKLCTWLSASKKPAYKQAATVKTLRQPNLAAASPDNGMVTKAPPPMHKSKSPSTPSFSASRVLKSGTRGAQLAMPKPPIKKQVRVASSCHKPGCSCSIGLTLVSLMKLPRSPVRLNNFFVPDYYSPTGVTGKTISVHNKTAGNFSSPFFRTLA